MKPQIKKTFKANSKAIKATNEFDTIEELIDEENKRMTVMNPPQLPLIDNSKALDQSLLKQVQIRSNKIYSTLKLRKCDVHNLNGISENIQDCNEVQDLLLNLNVANFKRRLSKIQTVQPIVIEANQENEILILNHNQNFNKINTFHSDLLQSTTRTTSTNNIKKKVESNVNPNTNCPALNDSLALEIRKDRSLCEDDNEFGKNNTISMQSIAEPQLDHKRSAPIPKTPSKWKKLSNVIKSISSFKHYDTKPIGNELEFEDDLRDYKERLFDNTLKVRQLVNESHTVSSFTENPPCNNELKETVRKAMTSRSYQEKSEVKINLKEAIQRIIINGDNDWEEKIEKLFRLNPERYTRDAGDPQFLFNTPLNSGKTIMYIACKEGKVNIVNFLLNKNLNALVKSQIGEKAYESPLECSCRWNYVKIVNLLLERVQYSKKDITEALKVEGVSGTVRSILKRYIKAKFRRSISCC